MKLSRRGLISVVSALAATTMGFARARARRRYKGDRLSDAGARPAVLAVSLQGDRVGSQEGRLFLHGAQLHTTAPRPSSRTRRTRSRAASPASRFRPPTAPPRQAFSPLAARAKIPVVVADIGTNSGDYVSFIISDNYQGAFGVGRGAGRRVEGEGLDRRLRGPHHHLASAQERPGAHRRLPRRDEERRDYQGSRTCSRCNPTPPTRRSSSPRTC